MYRDKSVRRGRFTVPRATTPPEFLAADVFDTPRPTEPLQPAAGILDQAH
jgi:hypothetical protein